MSLNLDEKTMKELEDKNRPQQPVIVEEKVVVEIPEEELQQMQDTQATTLGLLRQIATEMPRLTREIELQNFTRVLSDNMELKRKNALLEQEKKLAETVENIKQAGKASERSIEQTESRIRIELEEIREHMSKLWVTVFITIGSSVALSTIVWIVLFALLR